MEATRMIDVVRAALTVQGYKITTRPDHLLSYNDVNLYVTHE